MLTCFNCLFSDWFFEIMYNNILDFNVNGEEA